VSRGSTSVLRAPTPLPARISLLASRNGILDRPFRATNSRLLSYRRSRIEAWALRPSHGGARAIAAADSNVSPRVPRATSGNQSPVLAACGQEWFGCGSIAAVFGVQAAEPARFECCHPGSDGHESSPSGSLAG
jgi:hypothetical protein